MRVVGRTSSALRWVLLGAIAASVPLPSLAAQAAAGAPATIGDLDTKAVTVRKGGPKVGSSNQAMDNYRQFLLLQNADPALRA